MTEESVSEVEELEGLRTKLSVLSADNDAYMREHGLGMSPLAIPSVQIAVLVEALFDTEEERVGFDILVQSRLRANLEATVEEMEAERARQILTSGIGGVGADGAIDLSAFKDAPRNVRREAARKAAKAALRSVE